MKILKDDNCTLYIGENSISSLADLSCLQFQLFILVDENTQQYCLPYFFDSLPALKAAELIVIPPGEKFKNLNTVDLIISRLTQANADRSAVLINLGGGVIGDMGGFAASVYKRGISFIQIPTTLLAMVDASVGGKLGIDFQYYKNQIGLFAKPDFVCVDPVFLQTLPQAEFLSGFAEILKMYALFLPLQYREFVIKNQNHLVVDQNDIVFALEEKLKIVQEDFKEKGGRKLLNFGHTIGHAMESHFLDASIPLSHGHAVALGMVCELYLSVEIMKFSVETMNEFIRFIFSHFSYIPIGKEDKDKILNLVLQDKKNKDGNIFPILLKEIGQGVYNQAVPISMIEKSLNFYSSL